MSLPNSRVFDQLWLKQAGCCAICGKPMPANRWAVAHATLWKKSRPTFDHIHPKAKGGADEASNLQLAHARCNKLKGDAWDGV